MPRRRLGSISAANYARLHSRPNELIVIDIVLTDGRALDADWMWRSHQSIREWEGEGWAGRRCPEAVRPGGDAAESRATQLPPPTTVRMKELGRRVSPDCQMSRATTASNSYTEPATGEGKLLAEIKRQKTAENNRQKDERVSVKLHLRHGRTDGQTVRPFVRSFVRLFVRCVCHGRPSYGGINRNVTIKKINYKNLREGDKIRDQLINTRSLANYQEIH